MYMDRVWKVFLKLSFYWFFFNTCCMDSLDLWASASQDAVSGMKSELLIISML